LGEILMLEGHNDAALAELRKETPDDGQAVGSAMAHFATGRKVESDAQLAEAICQNETDWPEDIVSISTNRPKKCGSALVRSLTQPGGTLTLITSRGERSSSSISPTGHIKSHEVANCCPVDFGELKHLARRRPRLVAAFWKQAGSSDIVTLLRKPQ
jgi:hypothetical protein